MKAIRIDENGIEFDNGTKVADYHGQDCCERVYCDWNQLQDTNILDHEFKEVSIEGVENSGIRLNGYFIPCYNEQNGYYSSDLSVSIITPDGKVEEVDISNFVEDRIE